MAILEFCCRRINSAGSLCARKVVAVEIIRVFKLSEKEVCVAKFENFDAVAEHIKVGFVDLFEKDKRPLLVILASMKTMLAKFVSELVGLCLAVCGISLGDALCLRWVTSLSMWAGQWQDRYLWMRLEGKSGEVRLWHSWMIATNGLKDIVAQLGLLLSKFGRHRRTWSLLSMFQSQFLAAGKMRRLFIKD